MEQGGPGNAGTGCSSGRCQACGAEPWLWRVAEAGRQLVSQASYYAAPLTGRGEVVLRMMADRDEGLFFSPLDLAFRDLRAAFGAPVPTPAD